MRATANETEQNLLFADKVRRLQKLVRRNEKYKKRVYGEKAANKIEKSET